MSALSAGLPALAAAQAVTEYRIPTPSSEPFDIVNGPDGNLWFTERGANQIGKITTVGEFTEFPVPTAGSLPRGMTVGPDGNIWFTEEGGHNLAKITTAGVVTEFSINGTAQPDGVTTGPDGALWFTDEGNNQIGRMTTAGVASAFNIPTAAAGPRNIVTGPDGNLWFTEHDANQIGRLTTGGVFTEFPVPTAASLPRGINVGPDNNIWFTEEASNKIGQITTAGVITEFTIPTANTKPFDIAPGPDGNLWFTEENGNKIGRITTTGIVTEFPVISLGKLHRGIVAGPDGNMWWCERGNNKIARITPGAMTPEDITVDASDNGVIEVGETVSIDPSWKNAGDAALAVTGSITSFTGPAGPTYTIVDGSADYGTIDPGVTTDCATATGDCYSLMVTGARPADHWDAEIEELLSDSTVKGWLLHIGGSFTDVPKSQQFYAFIENIFHHGITGGCAAGQYCPDNSVTRAQMAVFLLKAKHGEDYVPPNCTGEFDDVACPSLFANWIEQLSAEGITGGCGGNNYCPNNPVTRAQMSAFLLKAEHGSAYVPPTCTGQFTDVTCPSLFADWIEQLAAEQITGGCGAGIYCPDTPNNRGQMAVFLVKTFDLVLYVP